MKILPEKKSIENKVTQVSSRDIAEFMRGLADGISFVFGIYLFYCAYVFIKGIYHESVLALFTGKWQVVFIASVSWIPLGFIVIAHYFLYNPIGTTLWGRVISSEDA